MSIKHLTTLLLALACCATAGAVDLEAKVGFDIRPQPLATALIEFSKQTQLQVMSSGVDLAQRKSPGINGKHSIAHALQVLLAGTGLEYSFTGPNTIAVKTASAPVATTSSLPAPGKEALRLAQVESAPREAAANEVEEEARGVPEMLVKGRRSINADIQRTEDDVQPYVVFDRVQIERSMAPNLEEFFKTRLPMNSVQATNSQRQFSGNDSSVALRGLSADQTLILVDGRRMPSVNTGGGGFGQPDINGIPLSIVERIEVLPSTASGIYGGGATGGVINIITRKDYAGVELTATYGNTFDSDASNRRIDASGGFSFENGRTQLLVTASYSDANPLLVGERDFTQSGRDLQYQKSPADFFIASTATTLPLGYTSNIRNSVNAPLILKAAYGGTNLGSPFTFIPVGYAGPSVGNVAGLITNAGKYNLQLPDDLNGTRQSLLNNPTVTSFGANLRRSFGASVDGYVDVAVMNNEGRSLMSNVAGGVTLAADAPNNPFTTAVNVRFPSVGIQSPYHVESDTVRATGGFIVRLPHSWTAGGDFVWSRASRTTVQRRPVIGDPDGTGPGLPGATVLANGTLNIMRDLNAYPIDYSPYLMPEGNSVFGPLDTVLRDATARLSGPVAQLPGGPLVFSAFASNRKEKADHAFEDVQSGTTALFTANFVPGSSQAVSSYYAELRAPLVSAKNALPFLRELEVQASVRRDEYKTRSPTPNFVSLPSRESPLPALIYSTNPVSSDEYTLGLAFSPIEDVRFRGSMGTGFLPPDIHQIAANPPTIASVTVADPRRGNVRASTGNISLYLGGNPALIPENSKSWSAGVVLIPRFLSGLRLSADFTDIEKTNEIVSLGFQALLTFEQYFPQAVTRAPLEANAPAGYTGGRILALDSTPLNFATTRLSAWDFQVDYTLRTGRAGDFQFFTLATFQRRFERQPLPTFPFSDSVGFSGGTLDWRGNVGLNWDLGPWSVGWSTQYFNWYYAGTSEAATVTAAISQGSATIPRQIYHDLFMRYSFDGSNAFAGGMLADTEISLGIQNVLDKAPPILATTSTVGGYSTYGDPRLRRYSLTLRKRF